MRFPYRYLIDRGIRGALLIEGQPRPLESWAGTAADTVVFDEPELRPAQWTPSLSTLSLDIETDPAGAAPALGRALGLRRARGAPVVPRCPGPRRLSRRGHAVCQRSRAAGHPEPAHSRAGPRRGDRLEHHRLRRAGADPARGGCGRTAGVGPRPRRAAPARQRRAPLLRFNLHPGTGGAGRHSPAARGVRAPGALLPGSRGPGDSGRGQDPGRRRSRPTRSGSCTLSPRIPSGSWSTT